jgi:type II secretory pathway predicted ATPase ExeA
MTDRKLLAFYGLKYNPFLPAVPVGDLWLPPGADAFLFRVETLVMDGGFALLTGDPGMGKSKLLHALAARLERVEGVAVGVAERPTSSLGDFYRELGQLFGVTLAPANRYGAFVALRQRWREHVAQSLLRPVLLVDEAQDAHAATLNELRILGSEQFDSAHLLTVVLAGDGRLPDRFRTPDLLPLGSRIRTRLVLQPLPRDDLAALLDHLLDRAGNPGLCTPGLKATLVDHSAQNPRVLCTMAAELLEHALQRQRPSVDEALFLEVFDRSPKKRVRA